MTVLNYTEFRNNLKSSLDSVIHDHETVIINRGSKENAVLISLDEYNSIQETLFLMSNEANRKRLEQSIEEDKKGSFEHHDLIED